MSISAIAKIPGVVPAVGGAAESIGGNLTRVADRKARFHRAARNVALLGTALFVVTGTGGAALPTLAALITVYHHMNSKRFEGGAILGDGLRGAGRAAQQASGASPRAREAAQAPRKQGQDSTQAKQSSPGPDPQAILSPQPLPAGWRNRVPTSTVGSPKR